jgi:hypothetical protein
VPGSTEAYQLTLDGDEVPWRYADRASHGFSAAQTLILRHLGLEGRIRSVEAGRIMHAVRQDRKDYPGGNACGFGKRSYRSDQGEGCCGYASTDGSAAMKRLLDRGIVRRISRGLYVLASDELDRRWAA